MTAYQILACNINKVIRKIDHWDELFDRVTENLHVVITEASLCDISNRNFSSNFVPNDCF